MRRGDIGGDGGSPRSRAPPKRGPTRVESEMRGDLTTRPAWSGCRAWGTRRSLPSSGVHLPAERRTPRSRFQPRLVRQLVPGQNAGRAISAAGPDSGPPPTPVRTPTPCHRPFGGPHPSCSGPGEHRSPALQTSLPPCGLRKLRLSWLRPEFSALVRDTPRRERQEEESDRRRWSLGGRRRRTPGARLSRVPPSSWPLCSSCSRSLPGRWRAGRS